MSRIIVPLLLSCVAGGPNLFAAEEEAVFSGPQVGEKLASFKVIGVFDDEAGKALDFVKSHEGKPQVLIFIHELTRPSIAVTRAVMQYAATRKDDDLAGAVVFLGEDQTGLEERVNRARRALPTQATIGISADGQEGPGSYGLNRNMTLTVLVAHEGKVTANFAIVQPTPAVDVPKIVTAITEIIGGEVPTLAQLGLRRYQAANQPTRQRPRGRGAAQELPPQVQTKLRQLIRRENAADDIKRIAAEIEEMTKDDQKSRANIGTIAGRVQNANYFADLRPEAQQIIRGWAKQFGSQDVDEKTTPEKPKPKDE